jgi:hypothetical protein
MHLGGSIRNEVILIMMPHSSVNISPGLSSAQWLRYMSPAAALTLHILPKHFIYVFRTYLTTNTDYFPGQYQSDGLYTV